METQWHTALFNWWVNVFYATSSVNYINYRMRVIFKFFRIRRAESRTFIKMCQSLRMFSVTSGQLKG
jgi:hypothetical protein